MRHTLPWWVAIVRLDLVSIIMTKLNFEVVVSGTPASSNYMCRTTCDGTASVLGLLRDATVPMAQVLADSHELKCLREAIQNMLSHDTGSFETLNLVFNAVDVPPTQERAPLDDVFVNPLQAIHICEDLQVACFTHLELVDQKPSSSDVAAPVVIRVTALEYSRSHRKSLLRQEFSSWLLEEHIEKSVVATDMNGVVCFWNRFAGELYQYTAHEAIGRSVFELFTSELTIEDAQVGMEKLFRGEHYQVRKTTSFFTNVSNS